MAVPSDVRKRVSRLRREIEEHDKRYYLLSAPTISDAEYDELFRELQQLESEYPELQSPSSPTQSVGGGIASGFKKAAHRSPMLSIPSMFSNQEIVEFDERLRRLLRVDAVTYSCELKFDGLAVNLTYERGKFVKATLRGTGISGEDVTANAQCIDTIPKSLLSDPFPELIEIRGEIVLKKSDFRELQDIDKLSPRRRLLVNPRNAASGAMRQLKGDSQILGRLSCFAYGVGFHEKGEVPSSQFQLIHWLITSGFQTSPLIAKAHGVDELFQFHSRVRRERPSFDFDIDGVVYKVDDITKHESLGQAGRDVRWAAAHKFDAEQQKTRLIAIDVQVGRTGAVTPVARLERVFVGQVFVENVTLHNEDEIRNKNLFLNDVVWVRRAGDVIPQIVGVADPGPRTPDDVFRMPTFCPLCQSPVVKEEGEAIARCTGGLACPAQVKGSLIHFASRNAMNIEGVGTKLVDVLVDELGVRSVADTYELPRLALNWLLAYDRCALVRDHVTSASINGPLWNRVFSVDRYALRSIDVNVSELSEIYERRGESDLDVAVLLMSVIPKAPPVSGRTSKRPRLGESDAMRLIAQINASKHPSLSRFLYALGIRHIGEEVSKWIALRFRSWESISKQDWGRLLKEKQELQRSNTKRKVRGEEVVSDPLGGIGEEMLNSLGRFFAAPGNRLVVERLVASGVCVQPEGDEPSSAMAMLAGKSFLFTGELATMKRSEAEREVLQRGGSIASNVRRNLDYLVVGERPGNKLEKAKEYGVRVMSEEEFLSLVARR